jgi:cell division protein FtsQ
MSALAADFLPPAMAPPRLATAGYPVATRPASMPSRVAHRRARPTRIAGLQALLATRPGLVSWTLGTVLFVAVGAYGAICGGEYAAFVQTYGSLSDLAARGLGFGIGTVTISGIHELSGDDVLALAGLTPQKSLAFLDAAEVRRRLKAQPLVQDVSVTKLYPDRLVIAITERQPYALWQKDGQVSLISQDGFVIDERRDDRHDGLPFVTGDDANAHVGEYVKLLSAAGDLKSKIRAGVLLAGRRWNLAMTSGLVVRLPEIDPAGALANLVRLEASAHILEKDIVALDLRMPGRIIVRLTDEAAAARAALLARKAGKRSGPT